MVEVARTIIDSDRLAPIMEIPENLRHRKVMVMIIAHENYESMVEPEKFFPPEDGIMGILKEYADPELAKREKEAWGMAVMEKYGEKS